jgi:hypothetical protein
VSVVPVATPVAPFDGLGDAGVPGGDVAPPVVNDHVTDVAIIAGFTGVANVFETIFQK